MCEFDARRMNGSPSQLTEYKVSNFDLLLQAPTLLKLEVVSKLDEYCSSFS